jgi:hypothetical protein
MRHPLPRRVRRRHSRQRLPDLTFDWLRPGFAVQLETRRQTKENPPMAQATLKNQRTLMANDKVIIRNQNHILRNQIRLSEVVRNQIRILRNQDAIIKNQKKILSNYAKILAYASER